MDEDLTIAADRVKACGNAVVPQVAEHVARRLVAFHLALNAASLGQGLAGQVRAPITNAMPSGCWRI